MTPPPPLWNFSENSSDLVAPASPYAGRDRLEPWQKLVRGKYKTNAKNILSRLERNCWVFVIQKINVCTIFRNRWKLMQISLLRSLIFVMELSWVWQSNMQTLAPLLLVLNRIPTFSMRKQRIHLIIKTLRMRNGATSKKIKMKKINFSWYCEIRKSYNKSISC